ncbi:hypothetical protein [Streptomyces cylindrosporus]|uniref:Uncharacterized protein n=1 Tax=Streptomyces cylindrosporus TaxID=2927583 RepID=A0ABS9YJZ8_9ACTN|nr:hypothetical protein [Streptomyces cylindrosporus]MCI3277548.1 hypothetical protein [Streptomyces cylindrosporus]
MAHTFEDLVTRQRAADDAHAQVLALRDKNEQGEQQAEAYGEAWMAWRDLAAIAQAAVTEYAKNEGKPRSVVEAEVKKAVRHPEPAAG